MYVVTHKECNVKLKNPYIFLQVGAALHPLLGYLADNVGDNISQKNENFCGLAGFYWIWKNQIRCKEILIYNTEEGSMLQQTLIQPLLKKIKSILKGHSSDCERN